MSFYAFDDATDGQPTSKFLFLTFLTQNTAVCGFEELAKLTVRLKSGKWKFPAPLPLRLASRTIGAACFFMFIQRATHG